MEYTFDFAAELQRVEDCFRDTVRGSLLEMDEFREINSWDTLVEEGVIGDESNGVPQITEIKIECKICCDLIGDVDNWKLFNFTLDVNGISEHGDDLQKYLIRMFLTDRTAEHYEYAMTAIVHNAYINGYCAKGSAAPQSFDECLDDLIELLLEESFDLTEFNPGV